MIYCEVSDARAAQGGEVGARAEGVARSFMRVLT